MNYNTEGSVKTGDGVKTEDGVKTRNGEIIDLPKSFLIYLKIMTKI